MLREIEPRFVERVWGSTDLSPLFPPQPAPIGEVWYETQSLLIKFLFTTAPLSVQVHPNDDYARLHENSAGKTEMWYILDAQPGSRIALGFHRPVPMDRAIRAAEDGTIEHLLAWVHPEPGDAYFTPAGTVHALGAGLTVLEIQQKSDVTYRLYDYGRGRELHLEKSRDVMDCGCHPGKSEPNPLEGGGMELARCPYFEVTRWSPAAPLPLRQSDLVIVLEPSGGYRAGQVFEATSPGVLDASGATVVLARVPTP